MTDMTAIVTGAGQGFGLALATALADRGAFVPLSELRGRPHLEMHTRGG